ncbi:tRNA (guanosine(46)-N7)-methyltransferase TrmB [Tundrisphaera lichenicola]|uniref:tRNA (guanosine(46)-N7)-methyltransferase TrmB n=1 Tax=Tundrisphaera lichenicola TaxID=2029860 RepID=UPI003EBBD566
MQSIMIDPSPYLIDYDSLSPLISWPELFGNDHPVELEIGSGKGLFLVNAATAEPGHNFFGIEMAKKYARKGAERVAKRGLANVRVLPGDALLFMSRYVPPASLSAVHVYFPDPWWKSRHRKRRVFAEPLVLDVERTLLPGGDLHIATDVEEYFGVIRDLMTTHPRFQAQPEPLPKPPEHDHDYLTNFERKYRIEGRPIYRAHYRFDVSQFI